MPKGCRLIGSYSRKEKSYHWGECVRSQGEKSTGGHGLQYISGFLEEEEHESLYEVSDGPT